MIQRIIVRPLAVEDVVRAATWYETRTPGLGEALIDEILGAIRRAGSDPGLFRIVRLDGEIRRVLTDRFPYRIFFSVVGSTLFVHAVLHGARHDRRWRQRP